MLQLRDSVARQDPAAVEKVTQVRREGITVAQKLLCGALPSRLRVHACEYRAEPSSINPEDCTVHGH